MRFAAILAALGFTMHGAAALMLAYVELSGRLQVHDDGTEEVSVYVENINI